MSDLWNQLAVRAGIELTDGQCGQISRYLDLLLAANQRMNLTRISDRASAEIQHIADALTLLPFLPQDKLKIADIGSGGGVPGIPLAIASADASFTLIESTKKKAAFLKQTIAELGLSNVAVLDQRVEEVGQSHLRETFDGVTVRAVAEVGWLAEWGLPLLKKGGAMLAMKGPKARDETTTAIRIINRLGGIVRGIHPVDIPELIGHVIVQIEKIAVKTPTAYPRPATAAKGKMLD